ncbi:hypothetical protein [Kocuria sp.]|uniref:hypothetical protein n=1 Tax=Kocuria sp. TaxID=1871328 RepID=UPI0026DC319A|nr:hypothetical protein [Kocuria sp.]MDO4919999.1 hypothetical protein [Kocuria sp.]
MSRKPSAPELVLTGQERTNILTRVVAEKTSTTKGTATVLRREPHTAWIQFGSSNSSLAARMGSGILMLIIHVALICVSLGLWLVVLLLPGRPSVYIEIIQVAPSGQVSTEQVTERRKVNRILADLRPADS